MTWHQHKRDQNYHTRLALVSKVRKQVMGFLSYNVPFNLSVPIAYSYSGGKRVIIQIELYKYMSNFKREFTNIRVILDDGTTVPLAKLRTKHLTKLYQLLNK